MTNSLIEKATNYLNAASDAKIVYEQAVNSLQAQEKRLQSLKNEQALNATALQALKDVKPLLAASALDKAQQLANQALQVVFQTDDVLKFSEEDQRFVIVTPDGETDLIQANGGGYLAVVSFIFSLFLLIKSKNRRFLMLDEQFTMISDDALERFISFLRKLCADLSMDVCLITHDARIQLSDVDNAYLVVDGITQKIK